MIRAARRHEIPLLPQIENAADQRYRRTGLDRWQGRGFGAALIDRSAAAARALGHQVLYLTTYRGVPWNEPFYRRRGFVEMWRGDLLPSLRRVLLIEIGHGHPSWRRAVMRRSLGGDG